MKLQKSNLLTISTASLLLSALVSGNVFAAEPEEYVTKTEFLAFKNGIKDIFTENAEEITNSAGELQQKVEDAVNSTNELKNKVKEIANSTSNLEGLEEQLNEKASREDVNTIIRLFGERTDEILRNHADELIYQDSSIKQLENKQDELIAKANSDIEVNNYVKEKLQEHDENLANKADKAELAQKANIADVGKSLNELGDDNKAIRTSLEVHRTTLQGHSTRLDSLDDYTSRLNESIANKADKTEVAQKANISDVEKNTSRIAVNSLNIQKLSTTKADAVELARVDNQVKSNQASIASVKSQVSRNTARIQNVEDRTNKLHQKLRHGLAAQAALTGLFQPYNVGKANISAAVGGYRSTTAVAVGTGYRFNEHVATKAGVAFSTGGNRAVSYHAGVNYEW